jgi:hypothetical protein
MAAGCIDSFGLAFGWTVFNLEAVYRYGLAAAALFNAAMLVGVALSAPASGQLTSRFAGERPAAHCGDRRRASHRAARAPRCGRRSRWWP